MKRTRQWPKSLSVMSFFTLALVLGGAATPVQGADPEQKAHDRPKSRFKNRVPAPPPPPILAHFHLRGTVTEKPVEDPFGLTAGQLTSLGTLLARLEKARKDNQVKAVVITVDRVAIGLGQLEELRRAIEKLQHADKPVVVHAEGMTIGTYTLLSAASQLSVAPHCTLWLTGMYGESLYLKGLLDMIGVEADFLQMGDFKSAAEILTRTTPSEAADENLNWLFDGLYDAMVNMISESRGIAPAQIRQLIDNGPYLVDRAQEVGLIDSVMDRKAFLAEVKEKYGALTVNNRYGAEADPAVDFSNPFAFFSILSKLMQQPPSVVRDTVGIIYVDGTILPGHAQPSLFGETNAAYSGDIRKALETAAADPSVKATVLRVNSPGGSAEASEVIWNAVHDLAAHKPLIVSMGDLAASGGYYVACGADTIFADATTITASIGVVGGKLITIGMWNKLGVNWVGYKRGANADLFNTSKRFGDGQRARLQQYMQQIYVTFKEHVRQGRAAKLTKPIEEVAGGRVYTGQQALEFGLVDQLGGLSDAIVFAAQAANLEDYAVRVIPQPKDFFTTLMGNMSGQASRTTDISIEAPIPVRFSNRGEPWQSLLSALAQLDPDRTVAFRCAIRHLELINRDGVALVMPQTILIRK